MERLADSATTMAKTIKAMIKLQIEAGKANPAPPVGPALGQHGLNIQEFCTKFNDQTRDRAGDIIPAEITYDACRRIVAGTDNHISP